MNKKSNPKAVRTERDSFTLTAEEKKKLGEIADKKGVSKSTLVRMLVRELFEKEGV